MDPILSLAVTLHSNKGCYALLLGSGVSRAAEIPTGWEVILDLTRRLARLKNEDYEPDPAAWFKKTFGKDPDYADLVDQLAKTPTERNQLLRPYFEPTPEDREQGRKLPTRAHKAIASLVERGFVRVIVTTNFDKLMEQALEEVGIQPQVIASPDAAEGSLPLAHARCTVVKVHGDYLDTRIKNAPHELEQYDDRINQLLDRILDEYGLIVCGWSAEWDTALRAAIERCKGRRFSTYWMARGEPGEAAKALITLRGATLVKAPGADEFFSDLEEEVASLDEIDRPHPVSAKIAVATLKRYLADDRHRISLHDLVTEETERARQAVFNPDFLKQPCSMDAEGVARRLGQYEARMEVLLNLFVQGCHWGTQSHKELWVRCLERIGTVSVEEVNYVAGPDLTLYPALLLLYGGGIAAVAAGNDHLFCWLFDEAKIWAVIRFVQGENKAALVLAVRGQYLELLQQLPAHKGSNTAVSDYLYTLLRDPLRQIEPDDRRYSKLFDRFEYLSSIEFAHILDDKEHMLIGRFGRNWRYPESGNIMEEIEAERSRSGNNWPPLKAGMCGRSSQRFLELKQRLDESVKQLNWR